MLRRYFLLFVVGYRINSSSSVPPIRHHHLHDNTKARHDRKTQAGASISPSEQAITREIAVEVPSKPYHVVTFAGVEFVVEAVDLVLNTCLMRRARSWPVPCPYVLQRVDPVTSSAISHALRRRPP